VKAGFITARLSGPPKWATLNLSLQASVICNQIIIVLEDVLPAAEGIPTEQFLPSHYKFWEPLGFNVILASNMINVYLVDEWLKRLTFKDLYSVVPEKIRWGANGMRVHDIIHLARLCALADLNQKAIWFTGSGIQGVVRLLKKYISLESHIVHDFPKPLSRPARFVCDPRNLPADEDKVFLKACYRLWHEYRREKP